MPGHRVWMTFVMLVTVGGLVACQPSVVTLIAFDERGAETIVDIPAEDGADGTGYVAFAAGEDRTLITVAHSFPRDSSVHTVDSKALLYSFSDGALSYVQELGGSLSESGAPHTWTLARTSEGFAIGTTEKDFSGYPFLPDLPEGIVAVRGIAAVLEPGPNGSPVALGHTSLFTDVARLVDPQSGEPGIPWSQQLDDVRSRRDGFVGIREVADEHVMVFFDSAGAAQARIPIDGDDDAANGPFRRRLLVGTDEGAARLSFTAAEGWRLDHVGADGTVLSRASPADLPAPGSVHAIGLTDPHTVAIVHSRQGSSERAPIDVVFVDLESGAEKTRLELNPSLSRCSFVDIGRAADGRLMAALSGAR